MQQLQGFDIDSSYGSLQKFTDKFWFADLVARNNDRDDDFHFDFFSPIVIGRNLDPQRDIVHINITSMWFLLNIFRAIASGWVFQLNGDATFSFCRTMLHLPKFSAVGMLGFVSRCKRQGTDAQHAVIGREVMLTRLWVHNLTAGQPSGGPEPERNHAS